MSLTTAEIPAAYHEVRDRVIKCRIAGHRDPHAENLAPIIDAVFGALMHYADPDSLQVYFYRGETKNCVWCHVAGKRYYLSDAPDRHGLHHIALHARGRRGPLLHVFDDDDPAAVDPVFAALVPFRARARRATGAGATP